MNTHSQSDLNRPRNVQRKVALLILLGVSTLIAPAAGQDYALSPSDPTPSASSPWFTGYTLGGGAFATSIDDGWASGLMGSAGLVVKESSLFYVNVAGSVGESRGAGSSDLSLFTVGGGYRYGFADGLTSLGVSTFYDELKIKSSDQTSTQQSFGIDAAHDRWFANANWYEPLSGDTLDIRRSATQVIETRQSQFRGWDAEIGATLFREPARPVNLIVALGYYDFSNAFGNISGVRARTDLTFWDHFSLGAEWRQNGAQFGQEWRFTASVRFAIGGRFDQRIYVPPYDPPAQPMALAETQTPSGKEVVDVTSGKAVRDDLQPDTSGKYAKNVLPVLPPVEAPPVGEDLGAAGGSLANGYNPMGHGMHHLHPRTFWPSRSTRVVVRQLPPPPTAIINRTTSGVRPAPPPCNRCVSGKPIRFD